MKVLCSVLVLFLFAACASAQALSDPSAKPEVTVIQQKWRIDVRNPALEKDPIRAMNERAEEEWQRRAADRMNEDRVKAGMPPVPPPVRRLPAADTRARGLSVTYVYEVKVSNTGAKRIRTLTWEYVFFEPGTKREVGRRRFVSKVSIGPGGTRNVVARSASSPTGTIDATQADKKPRDQYSEQVVIRRVGYADGSVWQATQN